MSVGRSLLAVLLVGAITYSMRAGVILALAGRTVPHPVERMLRNVGPAVLTGLAVNLAADPAAGWPYLGPDAAAGLAAAAFVGWWRRNLLLATLAGMSAVWVVAGLG